MKLDRFTDAQRDTYDGALAELRAGRKRSHWMWFVFPQIAGLGLSPTARHYAIRDLDEARAYLAHPLLGARLAACVEAMLRHVYKPAATILGGIDAVKLRSSCTLFEAAGGDARSGARSRARFGARFGACLDAFYGGKRDAATLALLNPRPAPAPHRDRAGG